MKSIRVAELLQKYESLEEVVVSGWIRTIRESKTVGFIELTDGTSFKGVQIVFDREKIANEVQKKFATGAAITAKGKVVITPDAPQPFEIQAEDIIIEGESPVDYPLQKTPFIRVFAHYTAFASAHQYIPSDLSRKACCRTGNTQIL